MLPTWIFDWAARQPDKIAAVHNGQPITYGHFASLILRARSFFHERDVAGPGVAVVFPGDPMDFWIVSLALRSLGLTTVAPRNVEMLEALSLRNVAVVTTREGARWDRLGDLCASQAWRRVAVSLHRHAGQLAPDAGPRLAEGGHILATSGTTGAFKKVLVEPAREEAQNRRRVDVWRMDERSVVAMFAISAHTGIGYRGPAAAWMLGARAVFHEGPTHLGLNRRDLTHALLTPEMVDAILDAPADAFARNDNLLVSVGGGPLTRAQAQAARDRITPLLFNDFGSTETGVMGFTLMRSADDLRWHQPAPGHPVEIVDEADLPVPAGQIGALRAKTSGVSGYLDNEEATARFFRNGFFYPGDLAVMCADGRFALQGRVTDVINVRGSKFSPAPIEEALREALGVAGVCLFSRPDETGEEQLHVIVESPKPIPMDQLLNALKSHVFGFPGANVHYLPRLPRDPAGKLQRNAAREAALARR